MEVSLKDIEKIKTNEMKKTDAQIKKLYTKWAAELEDEIMYYSRKTNPSAPLSAANLKKLKAQIEASIRELDVGVAKIISDSAYRISDTVVSAGSEWLEEFGIEAGIAFSNIANDAVLRTLQGQIYENGHSLSKAIWGNSKAELDRIYDTIAKGMAQNKSIAEIAKGLEQFVNPAKRLAWRGPKGGLAIYPYKVDYNAQRLARTLIQHAYQQSLIATTKGNPFIKKYIWRANGSRACEICLDRDGKKYTAETLPLDHPNGMCVIDLEVEDNYEERLAAWVNGNKDKAIDNWLSEINGTYVGK